MMFSFDSYLRTTMILPKGIQAINWDARILTLKGGHMFSFDIDLTPGLTLFNLLQLLQKKSFISKDELQIPAWFKSGGKKALPCTMAPDWPSVYPACSLHDWLYWLGGAKHGGYKRLADSCFRWIMEHNSRYFWDDRERGPISRTFAHGTARAFHRAVRTFAGVMRAFRYRPQRLNVHDPDLEKINAVERGG